VRLPVEDLWVARRVAKVTLRDARDKPGVAADLFSLLSELGINAEFILQGPARRGRADLAFLVLESELPKVMDYYDQLVEAVDAHDLQVDRKVALLVFYGSREMHRTPGVAATLFNTLAAAGVNIDMISTSLDSIAVVIREERVDDALEALREYLDLEVHEGYYEE